MFDVTVGDGIVNRLGCALVVIEKMRGLERVEIAIERVVSILFSISGVKSMTLSVSGKPEL